MLDRIQRSFVEKTKDAKTLRITINGGGYDELSLVFDGRTFDTRKLSHDVALAIQDYFGKANAKLRQD